MTSSVSAESFVPNIDRCWNAIGVEGDRSCPRLTHVIHCRNCDFYSAAGQGLLEREAPSGYRQDWTRLLAETQTSHASLEEEVRTLGSTELLSIVIFRLAKEWLGLPAYLFQEVTPLSPVHHLPQRSNAVFRGLVNIRGEIQLCIALEGLLNLQIADGSELTLSPVAYQRFVVIEKLGSRWVFAVDEVYGIQHFAVDSLRDAPASLAKSTNTYTKGLLHWRGRYVNYLDDELLFDALTRRIL